MIDVSKEEALEYLRQMLDIRSFEEKLYELLSKNLIRGASHLSAGQEAVPVGATSALQEHDLVASNHRGHGHCYARGAFLAKSEADRQEHLNKMMGELCGRATGYSRGRGGSMHIADVQHGNLGATGIVAGNIPVATGSALSSKLRNEDKVTLCYFGDGAINNGIFHESANMAALWKLPVIYIVENNLYAMSNPIQFASAVTDLASRGCAYGIPGVAVDGQDVFAVREAVQAAIERARRGEGPTIIEAKTYRWYGHSRSDPRAYRTREEEAEWKERDPILVLKKKLMAAGMLTEEEFQQIEAKAKNAVEKATEFALNSPYPPSTEEELFDGLYAPMKTTADDVRKEAELRSTVKSSTSMRTIAYSQALNEALREELNHDPNVFLMGEDIGIYGGAYGATKGL
ncbi:MAG: thiamine pyrophosphate-dependent enzyme, partial [Anaerolineaceae bacterium]|nr:thiamine pyrophosphate-dependent enzyme [Anaerolineaceae bacterium]